MTLDQISRTVAEGIPGAKAIPGGGLSFTRRGFPAKAEFVPFGEVGSGSTDIQIDLGGSLGAALQVRTAGFWHDLRNLLGRHDFRVGDAEFDATFDIATSEPGFAGKVLTPVVRSILRHVSIYGAFVWRLSKAGFLLRIRARPETANQLDGWLVSAFQLLDAVPGAQEAERVHIGAVEIAIDAESSCQVCGAGLTSGLLVRCAKCSTPHHRDCWEFNGRCSTFACGETRYR